MTLTKLQKRILIASVILLLLGLFSWQLGVWIKEKRSQLIAEIERIDMEVHKHSLHFVAHTRLTSVRSALFRLDSISYAVYFDGHLIVDGFQNDMPDDADSASYLKLPFTLYMDSVRSAKAAADDSIILLIEMIAYTDLYRKPIPITIERIIPKPRKPEFKVVRMIHKDISMKQISVSLLTRLYNRGSFTLQLTNIDARATFPGKFSAKAYFPDTVLIPARDSIDIAVAAVTKDFRLLRDGLDLWFEKEPSPFEVEGKALLQVDTSSNNTIVFNFSYHGEIDVKGLIKKKKHEKREMKRAAKRERKQKD